MHKEASVESFRRDPGFAIDYLNTVLEDGDEREVMLALRRIAQAFGGVGDVAAKTDLNAKSLYRTLSAEGNPELKTLVPLLRALGMRLRVVRCENGAGGSTLSKG
jgi:probable addiction module antidote protein